MSQNLTQLSVLAEKPADPSDKHVEDLEPDTKPNHEVVLLRSKFADYTKPQIIKRFWRLCLTGLAVSLGGMYAILCLGSQQHCGQSW
jgi:hypothetical protein